MSIRHLKVPLALLLLAVTPANGTSAQTTPVAILNVSVIPMDGELRLPEHAVLVRDGRIQWVGPEAEALLPPGTIRIDGGGRYLVPGLADMHVHLRESSLDLLLANGVTTARELNGSDEHVRWRDEIAAGEHQGPRLFVASTLLTAEDFPVRHIVVTEPARARDLVRGFAADGYDSIKIYDGLSPEVYAAIVEEARRAGLPVGGHIPRAVGLQGVLRAGQSLEHTEKIVFDTMGHAFDDERLPEIAARIAGAGVFVTPTLASQRALAMTRTSAYAEALDQPEMRYVSRDTRDWWASLARTGESESHRGTGPENLPFYRIQSALVRALARANVLMLAGSDSPNPLMVPGFALHDELDALVAAGLSPREVLRLATVNAATAMGREGEFGRIAPGASADLLLVDADPLESVTSLRHPAAVMVRGEWLDRAQLDALLERAARGLEGSL